MHLLYMSLDLNQKVIVLRLNYGMTDLVIHPLELFKMFLLSVIFPSSIKTYLLQFVKHVVLAKFICFHFLHLLLSILNHCNQFIQIYREPFPFNLLVGISTTLVFLMPFLDTLGFIYSEINLMLFKLFSTLKLKLSFNWVSKLNHCNQIGEGNTEPLLNMQILMALYIGLPVITLINKMVLQRESIDIQQKMVLLCLLELQCHLNIGMRHLGQLFSCTIEYPLLLQGT